VYLFNNQKHGNRAKRVVEGPQLCHEMKPVQPQVIRGEDFLAVKTTYRFEYAAPGREAGSLWTQLLVFPEGERYFFSMDRIDSVNDADEMTLHIDYRRDTNEIPEHFICAYRLRDPATGKQGPWLAGITLGPSVVYEAWCNQRPEIVIFILEFGGRPIKAGESFSAAFIVGYFDTIDAMHAVNDCYKGHTALSVDGSGCRLVK